MSKRMNVVVYNGRLLAEASTVDFVLWAPGRDFDILEEPDASVLVALAAEAASHERARGGRSPDGGDDSISGWLIVPTPA